MNDPEEREDIEDFELSEDEQEDDRGLEEQLEWCRGWDRI